MIYIDKKRTRLTSFTISKTLQLISGVDLIIHNLELLNKETFNHINIPDFDYKTVGNEITITSEYIKGNYINLSHMDILYKDLVTKPGEYSFHDYQFSNYIVRDNKIYAIDLDDYKKVSQKYREKDWLKIQREEFSRLEALWKSL